MKPSECHQSTKALSRIWGWLILAASEIEHLWQTSWRLGFYRGGPVFMSAISGIDIALWDLKGTRILRLTV